MSMMRELRRSVPNRIKEWWRGTNPFLFDPFMTPSYSQDGEDLILRRMFWGRRSGFYVDVGAHHPRRYSNTYLFYCMGWRGINIDPNSELIDLFRRERPRDINLDLAISSCAESKTYYLFNAPELNGFSPDPILPPGHRDRCHLVGKKIVQTQTLRDVLREHLPEATRIDFLSVDVEGYDLEVLQSNDWSAQRPTAVLAEQIGLAFDILPASPLVQFMTSQRYRPVSKTWSTIVFLADDVAIDV